MMTIEHKLGLILFRYIDRLNDICEIDTAEGILNEMLPEVNAALSMHRNDGYSRWYCGKCRTLNPSGSATCNCWNNAEWNQS